MLGKMSETYDIIRRSWSIFKMRDGVSWEVNTMLSRMGKDGTWSFKLCSW